MQRVHIETGGRATQLTNAVVSRLFETRLMDTVIEQVVKSLMENAALERLVAKVVTDLESSPAVTELVDRQMDRILAALCESDGLRKLIREQAGEYLDHLAKHPESVQRVIQDQSRGVVREMGESIRERVIALDDALESWARRMVGRT